MDKKYKHKEIEQNIYKMWEEGGYFNAQRDPEKEPYTIVLPPPNASGRMHTGNVLMIAIEDLLIRWKRMQGYSALWVPGTDHAGFETQITFERKLAEMGKSRFDFDRKTLYNEIWNFVQSNKGDIDEQMKSMGASVDWSRYKFTLDEDVVDTVMSTFEKMHKEGLVYRDNYMVNYCPTCGTTFADLEVKHKAETTSLYYINYPLADGSGNVAVATTRPEPIFVDTHVAVHPNDEEKKHLIGKKVLNPITDAEMEIIADEFVDPEFGTGAVKMTPAHDKTDYEVAKKHGLPITTLFELDGTVNEEALKHEVTKDMFGMTAVEARKKALEIIESKGRLRRVDDNYHHSIAVCYKGGHVIEPTVLPNWFVAVESLKNPALEVVQREKVKIYPKWQEITYVRWMEEMHDWPISRQVVWGIRIPVWYSITENPDLVITFLKDGEVLSGTVSDLLKEHSFEDIEAGLQTLIAPKDAKPVVGKKAPGGGYLQETDTFDTWFSSGHWPLVCLGYPDGEDFKYFYPTSVLETGWEIIRLWVSRMIMFGIYLTGQPPFGDVYLHGIVKALDGKKMSKSLGNVVNPEEYQEEYGTDALRMGLISGTANGKDFSFPQDKVISYRNFANKLWNMARFMNMMTERSGIKVGIYPEQIDGALHEEDKNMLSGLSALITDVDANMEKYRFADAADAIYHFAWDEIADKYIEHVKDREDKEVALSVLRHIFVTILKLLHPFMPFVTEELYSHVRIDGDDKPLIVSDWPVSKEFMQRKTPPKHIV